MLIDDSEVDIYINKNMLQISEFAENVLVKHSAQEALDFLNKESENVEALPSVIFLDLMMPGMDGFGFLKEFEKLPNTVHNSCKIIVLTSSVHQQDHDRAMQNRFVSAFMTKPLYAGKLSEIKL